MSLTGKLKLSDNVINYLYSLKAAYGCSVTDYISLAVYEKVERDKALDKEDQKLKCHLAYKLAQKEMTAYMYMSFWEKNAFKRILQKAHTHVTTQGKVNMEEIKEIIRKEIKIYETLTDEQKSHSQRGKLFIESLANEHNLTSYLPSMKSVTRKELNHSHLMRKIEDRRKKEDGD